MRAWSASCLVLALLVPGAQVGARPARGSGQGDSPAAPDRGLTRVDLRVIAVLDGRRASIDRGARDGLLVGDQLVLSPRAGGHYRARVVELEERTATVEIVDLGLQATPGMRGETWLPSERFASDQPRDPAAPASDAEEGTPYGWRNEDADWEPGMYLLAGVRPPRPAERESLLRGRVYTSFDGIWTSEDGRSSRIQRHGTDLVYQNLTGRGDDLRFGAEWNRRSFDLPDQDDQSGSRLRIDRLSYTRGGDRFDPRRLEVGRFLQHGMPAFGVLDGLEFTQRTAQGHAYGASVGFMPEPDWRYDTGHDFQIAAWSRWVADAQETLSAALGYQKTWHNGAADRDLVVLESRYLPLEGWRFHGTLWVDVYTSGDEAKGAGPELTQAFLNASRDFAGKWGLGLTYAHLAYPELDRDEFYPPVDAAQLADDRVDRLGLDGWWEAFADGRWTGRLGLWSDQDDAGGDAEVGVELRDRIGRGTRLHLELFGSEGAFTRALGLRLGAGAVGQALHSDVFYEFTNHNQRGFSSDSDDIYQHRLRGSVGWRPSSAWSLSAYLDGIDRETESSAALGVFLQWHF